MFICGIPLHEQFFNLVLNVLYKFNLIFTVDSSHRYIKHKRIVPTVFTVLERVIVVSYVNQAAFLCLIGYPSHPEPSPPYHH